MDAALRQVLARAEEATQRAASDATGVLRDVEDPRASLAVQGLAQAALLIAGARALIEDVSP